MPAPQGPPPELTPQPVSVGLTATLLINRRSRGFKRYQPLPAEAIGKAREERVRFSDKALQSDLARFHAKVAAARYSEANRRAQAAPSYSRG